MTLAAVVAAAAVYEWARPAAASPAHPAAAKEAVRRPTLADGSTRAPDKTETPLPNPVAGAAPVANAVRRPRSPAAAQGVAPARRSRSSEGARTNAP